jgi:hypothetical protein
MLFIIEIPIASARIGGTAFRSCKVIILWLQKGFMASTEKDNEIVFSEEEGEENPPNAGLARTLANGFNYTFHKAIADLIDNSIAAEADNIWIHIEPQDGASESPRPFVAIVDDGHGMSLEKLIKALEYGAKSSDEAKNLGNFGLGMKTASTSQSYILAVSTREDPDEDYNLRAWDIPWIDNLGQWKLRVPLAEIFPANIMSNIEDTSGTAILLYDLSRMKDNMNTLHPANQVQSLQAKIIQCSEFISMVYHRFITGNTLSEEYSGKQINFFVNGELIEAWDPFISDHPYHEEFEMEEDHVNRLFHMHEDTGRGSVEKPIILKFGEDEKKVRIRTHLLPKLSAGQAPGPPLDPLYTIYAGKLGKDWQSSQGVYVYRLDRMIEWGGWLTFGPSTDSHFNYARLSVDFGREWDDIVALDATKSRIIIPNNTDDTFRQDFRTIFAKIRTASVNLSKGGWPGYSEGDGDGDEDGDEDGDGDGDGDGGEENPVPRRRPRPRRLDQNTINRLVAACDSEEEKAIVSRAAVRAARRR